VGRVGVRYDDGFGRIFKLVVDIIVTQNAADGPYVKGPVFEGHSAGQPQIFSHRIDGIGFKITIAVNYSIYLTGLPAADIESTLATKRHLAGLGQRLRLHP